MTQGGLDIVVHRSVDSLYVRSQRARRRRLARRALMGILLLLIVLAIVLGSARMAHAHDPVVHEYNGTSWLDDQCYVDDGGVLWCSGAMA